MSLSDCCLYESCASEIVFIFNSCNIQFYLELRYILRCGDGQALCLPINQSEVIAAWSRFDRGSGMGNFRGDGIDRDGGSSFGPFDSLPGAACGQTDPPTRQRSGR